MTHWEGASLTCANEEHEPYVCPSFGEGGGLTMSLGILRWMIWLGEKQGDIFQSRRKHTAVSSLQTPALHHSGCTQTLLAALKKLLSAPKIYHLHLLCAAVQTSPEAQTPPLHYPLLCQPLGHLEASFAMIVRLAGQGTAEHHTANIFWLCPGCWLQRPTGNAATSNECPLVIKELY